MAEWSQLAASKFNLCNQIKIDKAKDENEVWKVAYDIINPAKEKCWSMNINNETTTDTTIISNAFNNFFVEKIKDLKANITSVKVP